MKQPEMVWDGQEMARNWTTNWELFVIWSVFLTKMACRGNGWDEVGKPPGNSRKIDSKWFEIVKKKWPRGVFNGHEMVKNCRKVARKWYKEGLRRPGNSQKSMNKMVRKCRCYRRWSEGLWQGTSWALSGVLLLHCNLEFGRFLGDVVNLPKFIFPRRPEMPLQLVLPSIPCVMSSHSYSITKGFAYRELCNITCCGD